MIVYDIEIEKGILSKRDIPVEGIDDIVIHGEGLLMSPVKHKIVTVAKPQQMEAE